MAALLDMAYRNGDQACFELSFTQRMIGFAVTTLIGLFSGFLAVIAIPLLRIRKFSLLFSICNLMILSSTGFLIGFKRQLKSLCERKRWIASIGMFAGMTITFLFALRWRKFLGVLLGVVVEFVSFSYYALSYVPWGSDIFHRCFRF
jgi:hypothetical protein